jgi:hypothetical protein
MGNFTTTGTNADNRLLFIGGTSSTAPGTGVVTVNGTVSISDVDFQGIRVLGTAAPISGTRIGNREQNNSGITFTAAKTVYWNLAGTNNWSATGWATSSGGAPNRDNFPLAQDTAVIDNTGAVTQINLSSAFDYLPSINMTRTTAFTFNFASAVSFFGTTLTFSSGATISGTSAVTFSDSAPTTFTSAGKTVTFPIVVARGTLLLGDACTSSSTMTVTIGTFDTAGYATTFTSITLNSLFTRSLYLRSSTVTLTGTGTSLTLQESVGGGTIDAGTSTINLTASTGSTIAVNGYVTLNNVTITPSAGGSSTFALSLNVNLEGGLTIAGALTLNAFNAAFSSLSLSLSSPVTVGSLAVSSPLLSSRVRIISSTAGTRRTLTCGSIGTAGPFDFRDIQLAGAASPVTFTDYVGDLGNNVGINFPAGRNVYWNLAGSNSWNANGWALTSGGTPSSTVYPLAQDTAIIDDNSAGTSLSIASATLAIGNLTFANRTTAFTFVTTSTNTVFYGDVTLSSALTLTSTTADTITFSKYGTQTLTTAGLTPSWAITVTGVGGYTAGTSTYSPTATTLVLGSAYTSGGVVAFIVTSANFNAATYNFTVSSFTASNASAYVNMGSGTWTLTGTGTVINFSAGRNVQCGTADVLLSNNTTTARSLTLGMAAINKLTIGGNTSTSTTTINAGSNNFTKIKELTSTKTVAHTVTLENAAAGGHYIGRLNLVGTAGNVVTLNGSTASATVQIWGMPVSGVDYLNVSNLNFGASPTPFYAGANSTLGSGNTSVSAAAVPTPRTLYWVGGTGNWSSTTKWDTTSGGPGGAAVPTVMDDVVFNSASNATAYTATIDTTSRCRAVTFSGPASGNLTLSAAADIFINGNVLFAATGVTNSMGNQVHLVGDGSYTYTTNGVRVQNLRVMGMWSTWTLGSAMTNSDLVSYFRLWAGTFNTAGYAGKRFGWYATESPYFAPRTFNFSNSTLECNENWLMNESTTVGAPNITVTATSSTINMAANGSGVTFRGNGDTYNTVNRAANLSLTLQGSNTFTTFAATYVLSGFPCTIANNQTIGTLTINTTSQILRNSLLSSVIGTNVTLTVTTADLQNVDIRNITLAGSAAPYDGSTKYLGDMTGNSGITFPAPKTVYWNLAGAQSWTATGWAATSGGSPALTNFPLVQDTAVIDNASAGTSIQLVNTVQIAKLDMSARTTAFTWVNTSGFSLSTAGGGILVGPGIAVSGTSDSYTFIGTRDVTLLDNKGSGNWLSGNLTINKLGGSVTTLNAITFTGGLVLTAGTFNTNGYTCTLATMNGNGSNVVVNAANTLFTLTGASWSMASLTRYNGVGSRVSMTSASAKTFTGGSVRFNGLTVDQAGAGALSITGTCFFAGISSSYTSTGAATITFPGGASVKLTSGWNATGTAGNLLTLLGSTTALLGINYLGSGTAGRFDYTTFAGPFVFGPDTDTWYAGTNSTQNRPVFGVFFSSPNVTYFVYVTEAGTGSDSISATVTSAGNVYNVYIVEVGTGTDSDSARFTASSSIVETATGTDTDSTVFTANSDISETATGTDADSATSTITGSVDETAAGADSFAGKATFVGTVTELASVTDLIEAVRAFLATITETATGTDTTSATFTANSTVDETGTITDIDIGGLSLGSSISETATINDADLARMLLSATVDETGTITDIDIGGLSLGSSISETATGTDTDAARYIAQPSISETATATDAASTIAAFRGVVAEAATGTTTNQGASGMFASVAETATGSDTDSTTFTANAQVVEGATIADVINAYATFVASITEQASGIDTIAALRVINALISELTTASDTVAAGALFSRSISEGATIADAVATVNNVFGASLNESAQITGQPNAAATVSASFVDAATITDATLAAYLWNLINDSQTANWQNINDAQTPGWQTINDAQTTSWTVIKTQT